MTSSAVLLRVAGTHMFISRGYKLFHWSNSQFSLGGINCRPSLPYKPNNNILKLGIILFDKPEPNGRLFEINFSFGNTLGFFKPCIAKIIDILRFWTLPNYHCPLHSIEDGILWRHGHYITLFFAFCLPCGARMMINVVTVQGATFYVINILLCTVEVAELSSYKHWHKHQKKNVVELVVIVFYGLMILLISFPFFSFT